MTKRHPELLFWWVLGFGVSKISTASLFNCCVYTGEQRTFMGILLLPIPGLEQARVFLYAPACRSVEAFPVLAAAGLFSIADFLFIRMQIQEGTFCALCFIAADDTITPDTPREHKLKEV